jgi:hypothetical protein
VKRRRERPVSPGMFWAASLVRSFSPYVSKLPEITDAGKPRLGRQLEGNEDLCSGPLAYPAPPSSGRRSSPENLRSAVRPTAVRIRGRGERK